MDVTNPGKIEIPRTASSARLIGVIETGSFANITQI
jgi:hypothetical protein